MYSRELTTFISVVEQGSFLKASKEYKTYYGIVYAKQPSEQVQAFIGIIQNNLNLEQ